MNTFIVLALAPVICGFGQVERLDQFGNSTCVQVETGEVRRIESNTGGPCPGGSYPNATVRGSGCTMPSSGQTFYPERAECPNGTARMLDRWGNPTCMVPR
jgi:hypothetical protein